MKHSQEDISSQNLITRGKYTSHTSTPLTHDPLATGTNTGRKVAFICQLESAVEKGTFTKGA